MDNQSLHLYLVTDSRWLNGRSLADVVEEAIDGGVTFVQLREKDATTEELVKASKPLIGLCRSRGIPFVIDDDVEAVRISGADGVHVGQSDSECREARSILGPEAIIGVSAHTVEEATAAQAAGADYIGAGAVFHTGTKENANDMTMQEMTDICNAVDIPVVAIGGIDASNAAMLKPTGVAGIAVVSAIMAAENPRKAAEELDRAFDEEADMRK